MRRKDVEAVLPHLPEVVRDMVQLQRFTGMRPGQLATMRLADVDRSDADVWLYRPTVHKNLERGKVGTVAIGPQGQAASQVSTSSRRRLLFQAE